jgi:hypothetical protein
MRIISAIVIVTLTLATTGCRTADRHPRGCGEHKGTQAWLAAPVKQLRSFPLGTAQPVDAPVRLMDIQGPGVVWQVVAGPNLNDPGRAMLTVNFSSPEPVLTIENGWLYVSVSQTQNASTGAGSGSTTKPAAAGAWGQARTRRVSGIPEGTRFIMQEQGGVERAILTEYAGHALTVRVTGVPMPTPLTASHSYLELGTGGSPVSGSYTPGVSTPVSQLVGYIEGVAAQAGL